ncbi:MAG: sigma factor-like helix-turn-helix DNA-binding protein [Armatimonadota bacterium]
MMPDAARGLRALLDGSSAGQPDPADADPQAVARLTRVVRLAMGRLGCVLAPYLDEGLLLSEGLMALAELAAGVPADDEDIAPVALRLVVGRLRRRARASSWFRVAWPCRVAPLCAAIAERGPDADGPLAEALGLPAEDLSGRFVEAGLVFAVSPELILPEGACAEAAPSAVSTLPERQRRLLAAYFQGGLSFPEIARLLGLPGAEAQELFGRAATGVRAQVPVVRSGGIFRPAGRCRAGSPTYAVSHDPGTPCTARGAEEWGGSG